MYIPKALLKFRLIIELKHLYRTENLFEHFFKFEKNI